MNPIGVSSLQPDDFATPIVANLSSIQSSYSASSAAIMSALGGTKVLSDIAAPLQQALKALDALQGIHPFIGSVEGGFRFVSS